MTGLNESHIEEASTADVLGGSTDEDHGSAPASSGRGVPESVRIFLTAR
jgi:hypothetical protein